MYLIYVVTFLLAICFLGTARQCFKEMLGGHSKKIPKRNLKKMKNKARGLLIGELTTRVSGWAQSVIWMPLAARGTMWT